MHFPMNHTHRIFARKEYIGISGDCQPCFYKWFTYAPIAPLHPLYHRHPYFSVIERISFPSCFVLRYTAFLPSCPESDRYTLPHQDEVGQENVLPERSVPSSSPSSTDEAGRHS